MQKPSSVVDSAPRRPKIKLDISQFEDPLLAMAMGCKTIDANDVKRPDSPVEIEVTKMDDEDEDEDDSAISESAEIDDDAWQLVVHARVYALADK